MLKGRDDPIAKFAEQCVSIVVDSQRCVGCMLCVLECSFLRVGKFQPSAASSALGNRRGQVGISTSRVELGRNIGETDCELCLEHDPLPCERVCPVSAITRKDRSNNG